MVGTSDSTAQSYQSAYQNIAQYYSGSCQFSCNNLIDNLSVIVEDTTITGGIKIEQNCYVDGACLLQNTTDAVASIMLSANNSAGASDAGGWLAGLANFDFANAVSFQDMRQLMNQAVSQKCNFTSNNDMENVVVYASGSGISGGILIDQTGNTSGSCTLNDMMEGTATATGQATNDAQSGKKAKSGMQWLGLVGIVAAIIVVIVVIVGAGHYFMCSGEDAKRKHPGLCGKAKSKRRRIKPPTKKPTKPGEPVQPSKPAVTVAPVEEEKIVQNFVFGDAKTAQTVMSNLGVSPPAPPPPKPQPKLTKQQKQKYTSMELKEFYPNFKGSDLGKDLIS